jgi:hypothetical protein
VACPITNCRRCAASKTISIYEWEEARIKDVIDIEGRWICYWAYFKVRSWKGRLNLMRSSWHHRVSHTIGPGLKEELKGLHLYSWNYQFCFRFPWKMWIPVLALITSTLIQSVWSHNNFLYSTKLESRWMSMEFIGWALEAWSTEKKQPGYRIDHKKEYFWCKDSYLA